jgi:hypothetical protein
MNIKKLEELESLARLFYSIKECAVILEMDHKELQKLITNPQTPESKKYHRGLLLSEKEVREKIIEMATRGSSKAQLQAMELINSVKIENYDEEQS